MESGAVTVSKALDRLFASLPERLSIDQLTDLLGLSARSVTYKWLREGNVPAMKIGGTWLILRDDVREHLEAHGMAPHKLHLVPNGVDPAEWQHEGQAETHALPPTLDAALDTILPEAFATCREASRRVLGLRHYDVQLLGGAGEAVAFRYGKKGLQTLGIQDLVFLCGIQSINNMN